MGSVSSKPPRRASRHRTSADDEGEPRNQQNNHIIKENGDTHDCIKSRKGGGSRPSTGGSLSSSRSSVCVQIKRNSNPVTKPTSPVCTSNNNNTQIIPCEPSKVVGLHKSQIKVIKLKVGIDKKPTSLDEKSSAVLKYRTPHFRAYATVEIPELANKQSVRIGWIQTCSRMRFVNTYGSEGVTSWEFPEIQIGKYTMISDADGKQYPWYGSKHEIQTVQGPCNKQTVTVHMNDNFFPQVTWYIPQSNFDRTPRLTRIHRKQDFLTFLVMKDLSSDKYHILRVITWSMDINIEVKPDSPLGKRAKLLEPLEQKAPVVLEVDSEMKPESYAMKPPNANNAQTLMWRPFSAGPKVVVPPEQTTVDLDRYVLATKQYIDELVPNLREL